MKKYNTFYLQFYNVGSRKVTNEVAELTYKFLSAAKDLINIINNIFDGSLRFSIYHEDYKNNYNVKISISIEYQRSYGEFVNVVFDAFFSMLLSMLDGGNKACSQIKILFEFKSLAQDNGFSVSPIYFSEMENTIKKVASVVVKNTSIRAVLVPCWSVFKNESIGSVKYCDKSLEDEKESDVELFSSPKEDNFTKIVLEVLPVVTLVKNGVNVRIDVVGDVGNCNISQDARNKIKKFVRNLFPAGMKAVLEVSRKGVTIIDLDI
ncbi:hypothetical protein EDC39_11423 [Geothermobacter ehrlichii]|uniref:Uncharacterized protein n=1 Tax=Geothermobacter ehrlichii TaxID=213224 RepID=A0A5D3WIS5_9BACT|nr:hypothetical protein [Geothermobacter ehrlichii]TYO96318.1 hypothetical protein EDC39_11423 [Geothermobacter ehrlichii]